MVREIHLETVLDLKEREWLGKFSSESDYDELIDEDCDVYLPDGTLVLVYRKKALKTLVNITPERHEYWRWVSTHSASVNRGDAAGTDLANTTGTRFTSGQVQFFGAAKNGKYNDATLQECRDFVNANTKWNVWNYAPKWIREDKLFDIDLVETLEAAYKANKTQANLDALTEERNKWFDNWLERFVEAEDRQAEAKRAWKLYSGSQAWNHCSSNVVGAIDRQALIPWARLTGTTQANFEGFAAEAPFYHEADALFKETMPENHKYLYDMFRQVADPRYNLFDTAFTSITVNNNFRVAYHRDKLNCKDGIAILSCLDRGTYDGYEFIFPEMRLAFNIRHGDFLCGDNQGYIHGMGPMRNASPDAESIWFVFYSKDRLRFVDNLECENCRKAFKQFSRKNLQYRGNGKPSWGGVYAGMWVSEEWVKYKEEHCPEASNTNWTCTEK